MQTSEAQPSAALRDSYMEWALAQGVPIVNDFGIDIHRALWPKLVCYGFALAGTLIAAWALLSIGF